MAMRNSTKSNYIKKKTTTTSHSKIIKWILPISPELSVSNVLNTCEQNLSAFPVG
jgi:hypothetical protein